MTWIVTKAKWMNVLLKTAANLVESPTNYIEQVVQDRGSKIATFHMGHRSQLSPSSLFVVDVVITD